MALKIFGNDSNKANIVIAKVTASFASMGFNSGNILVIFEISAAGYKSWVPGRTVNGITGATAGKGYYIQSLADIDISEYFETDGNDGEGGGGSQSELEQYADAATITIDHSVSDVSGVEISATRTIAVENLPEDKVVTGILVVTHGADDLELNLPGAGLPTGKAFSSESGAVDILTYVSINGDLYWDIQNYAAAEEPTITTITQNFDGVTAPALPSGWTQTGDALITVNTGTAISPPNVLAASLTGLQHFYYNTPIVANSSIEATIYPATIFSNPGLFLRSTTGSVTSGNCYQLAIPAGTSDQVILYKVISGSATIIGQISGALARGTSYYKLKLIANGTTISAQVIRISDGYYLNSAGTFVNSVQTCISVTDSSVTAGGYSGYFVAGADTGTDDILIKY